MVKFKGLIISFLLVGLFTISLINFGGNLAIDNNANNSILDNQAINSTFTNLESNLGTAAQTNSTSQKEAFEGEVPQLGATDILLFSVVGVAKTFGSIVVGLYNITIGLASATLGIPAVVLGTITSILLFIIILLSWSVIKTGQ